MTTDEKLAELATELAKPEYAGMTDAEAAAAINNTLVDHWQELTSSQIFESIDATEFAALGAADKARVDRILGLGSGIKTAPGSQSRAELISIFGGGSQTISTLAGIALKSISMAQANGWSTVYPEDVTKARAL